MNILDLQSRQKDIRRDPRSVTQPQLVAPSVPGITGAPTAIAGKIIAVNRQAEEALLAPMIFGDPRNLDDWADDENFNTGNAICCWTMGIPVCDVGWPAVAVLTNVGFWLQYSVKWLPDDAKDNNPLCPPDGTLSPALSMDCDPFEKPGICSTKYACCLPGSECQELNEVDCAASAGFYYGPGTAYGTEDGLHCDEGSGSWNCPEVRACVDPADPAPEGCANLPAVVCPPGSHSHPCSCEEYFSGDELGCP